MFEVIPRLELSIWYRINVMLPLAAAQSLKKYEKIVNRSGVTVVGLGKMWVCYTYLFISFEDISLYLLKWHSVLNFAGT